MYALICDFRFAVRSLLRVPGFTLVAVLTLAAGLGTTTLMFTTANAAFLEPVPFKMIRSPTWWRRCCCW